MPGIEQDYLNALEENNVAKALELLEKNPSVVKKNPNIFNWKNSSGGALLYICVVNRLVPQIETLLKFSGLDLTLESATGNCAYVSIEEYIKRSAKSSSISKESKANAEKIALLLAKPTFLAAATKGDMKLAEEAVDYGRISSQIITEAAQNAGKKGHLLLAYQLTQLAETQVKKETEAQLKTTETKRVEEYIKYTQQTANKIAATSGNFAPKPQPPQSKPQVSSQNKTLTSTIQTSRHVGKI